MTPAIQNLVTDNLDLVRQVAARVARNLPSCIEMDEMEAAGRLGLCQAAIRFDPELHANFRVWAMFRIRGAIIDQYRGRNYPRLMEQMPDSWMGIDAADEIASGKADGARCIPPALIDPAPSILDVLIEQEETVVVCISAGRARKRLERIEGKAVDLHISGKSMREVGKRFGKSGTWGHYTVHGALIKMRALLDDEGEDAA
jgi:RNA polymerase sigma factor (sigma-70 family)